MGIFSKKNKNGDRSVNLVYVDGIKGYTVNAAVEVSMNKNDEMLVIRSRTFKLPNVNLKLKDIIGMEIVKEKDIKIEDKSVIGRAVVGTVLLGPLGAIIGGMSGIGSKKKKLPTREFLVFNYTSEKFEEPQVLSFEIVGATLHLSSFIEELVPLTNIKTINNDRNFKESIELNKNEELFL